MSSKMNNEDFDSALAASLAAFCEEEMDTDPWSPSPRCEFGAAMLQPSTSSSISLRQWIKSALKSVNNGGVNDGAASSAYLSAALKIAVSLTEQVSRAEKLAGDGLTDNLESLPVGYGVDWSSCIIVHLNSNQDYNSSGHQQYFAGQQNNQDYSSGHTMYQHNQASSFAGFAGAQQDYEMQALLNSCQVNGFSGEAHAYDANLSPFREATKPDHYNYLSRTSSIAPQNRQYVSYLNIDSAEIYCNNSHVPTRYIQTEASANRDKLQRIFSLALVFYELFSGGDVPPSEISSLPFSSGAFVSLPILSLHGSSGDQSYTNESKRHQGTSGPGQHLGLCELSFEYLKLMGVPGPVCQLILDMLDCVYGEFSRNECYTKMTDVTVDLQLMIDKPHKFLRGLDVEKLSVTGLPLNVTVFSRERELACIQACYHRSISGSCSAEMAILVGELGTGKTTLAHRVGQFVLSQGGIFLNGKFPPHPYQGRPFSALSSAFDQYCDILIRNKDSEWAQLVTGKLWSTLGEDAIHLIQVIPKLSYICTRNGNSNAMDAVFDRNCNYALQRLHYLLCQFVEVITSFSSATILTLFLDDIQFIDEASISVLNQLLMKGHRRFFCLFSCRDDEMQEDHPFWEMIRNIGGFGIKPTTIKLDCITRNTLNEMVSDLLCLPRRKVRSLSDIVFNKTKGNPLFFFQLMLALYRDGLIRLSLSHQRWEWDEEHILSHKLPDDTALCFAKGISKLPLEVQFALQTLSCFGASVPCEIIHALESLNLKLVGPLQVASAQGLIVNLKGSYTFCHEVLQEVCYKMTEEQYRRGNHSMYGLCLAKLALQSGNNEMLFCAVDQINLGGPEVVSDAEQSIVMAKCNYAAARRAASSADFSSTYAFCSSGISFLPENCWTDQYNLSLRLYELASKSALATGNIGSLDLYSEEVTRHARSFEDRLNIYFIVISSLGYASKASEAVERSRGILAQLGEEIPRTITHESLVQHISETQSMIKGISEADFLNYKRMTDKTKLRAMTFYAKMQNLAIMVDINMNAYVTLRMVQLTISHGLSPVSPNGLAYFGAILAKLGNVRVGYQFTVLAKALVEVLGSTDIAGEVISVNAEIQSFVEPMQAANELRVQGEEAAMRSGDVHFACINRLKYCVQLFSSGKSLPDVKDAFTEASRFMREHENKTCYFFLAPILRSITSLMDTTAQTYTSCENMNPRQVMVVEFNNLYLAFILHKSDVKKYLEKCMLHPEKNSWFLFIGDARRQFFMGLASYYLYRNTRDIRWAEKGSKCKANLQQWAEQGCSWNFSHQHLLLEAEYCYCHRDFEAAQTTYERAIASAKAHKFINDEALALELAAHFFFETGNFPAALEHFRFAHEKYRTWGALAKASSMIKFGREKFGNVLCDFSLGHSVSINSDVDSVQPSSNTASGTPVRQN